MSTKAPEYDTSNPPAVSSMTLEARLKEADDLYKAGKAIEAEFMYRDIIDEEPACQEAYEKVWTLWKEKYNFYVGKDRVFRLLDTYEAQFGKTLPHADEVREADFMLNKHGS